MSLTSLEPSFTFRERCDDAASSAISALRPQERTLAVQLIASAFVAIFAETDDGDDARAIASIDRMCDTYAGQPGVPKFLEGACTALEGFLAPPGISQTERDALRALDPKLRAVAQRARDAAPHREPGRDEIDAALERFMKRLAETTRCAAEHSRGVAAWSGRIARRLTLPEDEVRLAYRCGLIHDVGFASTPGHILNAPRNLTRAERAIVQQHTVAGCTLIQGEISDSEEFAAAIRSHHERRDGSGYPNGCVADEIPLMARIVSVADTFNAMIAPRPHRAAYPASVALEELRRSRGKQFDRDVVDAMLAAARSA